MNDDFNPTKDDSEVPSAPARRPVRRARRTLAPFSEAKSAELPEETAPEVPAEVVEEATPAVPEEIVEEIAPAVPEEVVEEIAPAVPAEAVEEAATAVPEEVVEEAAPAVPEEIVEEIAPAVPEEVVEEAAPAVPEEAVEEAAPAVSEEVVEEAAPAVPAEAVEEAAFEATAAEDEAKKNEELSPAANTFDWVKSFLFSLTVVIFVFTLLFRGVTVNGGSMLPTLNSNEYLIISDLFYTPKTGDIVVVQSPNYKSGKEPLIKRVIATGGQTVKINFESWEIWVDGKLLHEDYILRDSNKMMNPEDMAYDKNSQIEFRVDDNCIFVMGDHRNDSLDSRSNSVGQIDERYIMGRVLLRITPFEKFGKVE